MRCVIGHYCMNKNKISSFWIFFLKTFLLVYLNVLASNAFASFHKTAWPIWEVNNPLSQEVINHDTWQQFLTKHVFLNAEGIHLIDYAELKQEDIQQLNNYITYLSTINISKYNRKEQLAFWLNLYNALTVKLLATHYPVPTILEINISPGLFSIGPWGAKLVTINNQPLSLDDIHNRIIRPIWNDARTHYALNNGSIGAPNLHTIAFTGATLEAQLNQGAYMYINSLRGAQVIEGRLVLSKLYDWFEEDFGGSKALVLTHLLLFAKEPLKSQLKHTNTIDSYSYNWHVNLVVTPDT
jgi:hypothetical protein